MNPQILTKSLIDHTKHGQTKHSHTKRSLLVLCLLLAATLTAACDEQTPAHDFQTLEGRVELDAGNQFTGSTRGSTPGGFETSAQVVSIARITDTGHAEVLAEGSVESDGTFQVDCPELEGPFLVQVHEDSTGDEPFGRALVLRSAGGESFFVAPISPETTAEANAFVDLVALGHATAEIDAIALMANISAEMAAEIQAEVLAKAAWDAQTAWLSVASEDAGHSISAAADQSAKLEAWGTLTSALEASADSMDESSAWARYELDAQAALSQAFSLQANAQLTARAASAIALKQSVESASASSVAIHAIDAASFLGLSRETHLSWSALTQIASESGSAEASAAIDSAFSAYQEQLSGASSMDTVVEAQAGLFAALISTNPSEPSVMGTLMQGEAGLALPVDLESLAGVLQASAELELVLAANLLVAAQSTESADLAAKALLSYRAESQALVNSLTVSLYGQASLDLLETSMLIQTQALLTTSSL